MDSERFAADGTIGEMPGSGPIIAIVPAAGRSARMGTMKQMLPVNGLPMVMQVLDALLGGGADEVILVAHEALRAALPDLPPRVRIVANDDPDTAMIDSVRIGTAAAGEHPAGILVCPADAAGVAAGDVRRCIDAFRASPDRIVIATHHRRRGHPLIFPALLAEGVRSGECDTGLNQLARNRPALVRTVECDSPGAVANVNTPEDYQRLREM